MSRSHYVPAHHIRAQFAKAISDMYQSEVPLYGKLLDIVSDINHQFLQKNPSLERELGDLSRVSEEKHGAIRLGKPSEMKNMARLFAVMDMHPVGYYNLSVANLPVHSTAFRPVSAEALQANPFRIFCSLLRLDLLEEKIQERAQEQLNKRQIFSEELLDLIGLFEKQQGLTHSQADTFITAATETFKWHKEAAISKTFYDELLGINGLVADIIGFKGPHINHLTPRILDIDALHQRMKQENIAMIPTVQGPPKRSCDILLRQTSFQALSEPTLFPNKDGTSTEGNHRARFGEIEQRGIALTPKGRELYDRLLSDVLQQTNEKQPDYTHVLTKVFESFPDSYEELRKQELAYFEYLPTQKQIKPSDATIIDANNLEKLIEEGYVRTIPITYEDFLPVSAAGIFKSNLVEGGMVETSATQNREDELAEAIGTPPLDPFALYEAQQKSSIQTCITTLKKAVHG